MAGRPTKYNKARHETICNHLRNGCSRTTAAELVGINRETLEEWRTRFPAFSRDVDMALAEAKSTAAFTIRQAIKNGDVPAAFRYLALQERHEWQERHITEHTGESGNPISIIIERDHA